MENNLRQIKNILFVLLGILVVYLLYVLSSLLIPLALALFIAVLLQPGLAWFERKNVPFAISLSVVSATTIAVLWLFGMLIYQTGQNIVEEKTYLLDQIHTRLTGILDWVNQYTSVALDLSSFIEILSNLMSYDWLLQSSGEFAGVLSSFTGSFFMTALYLIGMLGGILHYEKYISYLEKGNEEKEKQLLQGFEQIKFSIVTYMKVKFIVSFFTGFSYFIICWAFGVKFALFWGFLAFLLNFIPTVGSIVATIPPLLLGLIQFDSSLMVVFLVTLLFTVQTIMGNIVEPRITGSRLSLSFVFVILGLVFWGYLWGVTGMILSVPLLVMVKVILSQFPDARVFVRMMGSGPEDEG